MGNEIVCRASLGAQTSEGKALLESDHLLFRGEFRCKVFFRDIAKVSADRGMLSLFGPEGELRLELGKKRRFGRRKSCIRSRERRSLGSRLEPTFW